MPDSPPTTEGGKRIYVHPDDASIVLTIYAGMYGIPVIETTVVEPGKAYFVDLDKLFELPEPTWPNP